MDLPRRGWETGWWAPCAHQCWTRQGDTVPGQGRAGWSAGSPEPGTQALLLAAERPPPPEAARLRHLRVRLVPQDAGLVGGALEEMVEVRPPVHQAPPKAVSTQGPAALPGALPLLLPRDRV